MILNVIIPMVVKSFVSSRFRASIRYNSRHAHGDSSGPVSELYHLSGMRTRVQKVKPKMAEFEEL